MIKYNKKEQNIIDCLFIVYILPKLNIYQEHLMNSWFLIANPVSGCFSTLRDWSEIESELKKYNVVYNKNFTKYQAHAIALTHEAIAKGYRNFIAVGGDGTAHEVANGILTQTEVPTTEITLAVIPVGTGNDWGRTIGLPTTYQKAARAISIGKTFTQDCCKASFFSIDKILQERYIINVAGMGYDAAVAKKANALKERGKGGKLSYLMSIFTTLLTFRKKKATISIDGADHSGKITSMNVGICKYSGGGMMPVPNAVPDDGLIDMTIIRNISKISLVANLKRFYDGTFIKHKKVSTLTGRSIKIESRKEILFEADGESLGNTPLTFEIVCRCLKVIVC